MEQHASHAVPSAAVVVGGGTAWAAALELALMLKEVSRIPAEGVETREGATSAMFGARARATSAGLARPATIRCGTRPLRALRGRAARRSLRLPGGDRPTAGWRRSPRCRPSPRFAAALASPAGHDVDQPSWTAAYYETARSAT